MSASDPTDSKLAQALSECERLRVENRQLRERLGIPPVETAVQIVSESSTQVTVTAKSSPAILLPIKKHGVIRSRRSLIRQKNTFR